MRGKIALPRSLLRFVEAFRQTASIRLLDDTPADPDVGDFLPTVHALSDVTLGGSESYLLVDEVGALYGPWHPPIETDGARHAQHTLYLRSLTKLWML